jgi:hypothetical protein
MPSALTHPSLSLSLSPIADPPQVEHFNKRIVNQQRAAATQAALSSPSRPP